MSWGRDRRSPPSGTGTGSDATTDTASTDTASTDTASTDTASTDTASTTNTDIGTEPDYRFSLANERTFLAWIRTSLALMAAAVAVAELVPTLHGLVIRQVMGLTLAALGLITSATAYARWRGNEQAMRRQQPLPRGPLLPAVAVGMTIVAVVVVVLVLRR